MEMCTTKWKKGAVVVAVATILSGPVLAERTAEQIDSSLGTKPTEAVTTVRISAASTPRLFPSANAQSFELTGQTIPSGEGDESLTVVAWLAGTLLLSLLTLSRERPRRTAQSDNAG